MLVLIATDGSRQSLRAARHFKSFADPGKVTDIVVLAVTRPLASVSFVDEISAGAKAPKPLLSTSFTAEATAAVEAIAAEFDDWPSTRVRTRVRSGTPSSQINNAAKVFSAELIVLASGSRGLTDTVLIGSTAQRVQATAPCPVLVVRPVPRTLRAKKGP